MGVLAGDPLGCPLIPRQDGIRTANPLAAALLVQLLRLLQLLHECARDQHALDKLSQTILHQKKSASFEMRSFMTVLAALIVIL